MSTVRPGKSVVPHPRLPPQVPSPASPRQLAPTKAGHAAGSKSQGPSPPAPIKAAQQLAQIPANLEYAYVPDDVMPLLKHVWGTGSDFVQYALAHAIADFFSGPHALVSAIEARRQDTAVTPCCIVQVVHREARQWEAVVARVDAAGVCCVDYFDPGDPTASMPETMQRLYNVALTGAQFRADFGTSAARPTQPISAANSGPAVVAWLANNLQGRGAKSIDIDAVRRRHMSILGLEFATRQAAPRPQLTASTANIAEQTDSTDRGLLALGIAERLEQTGELAALQAATCYCEKAIEIFTQGTATAQLQAAQVRYSTIRPKKPRPYSPPNGTKTRRQRLPLRACRWSTMQPALWRVV